MTYTYTIRRSSGSQSTHPEETCRHVHRDNSGNGAVIPIIHSAVCTMIVSVCDFSYFYVYGCAS